MPDSEPVELSQYFKTRDSDAIIEGLGTLLAAQTHRLKVGMEREEESEKLDPEVTRIIKDIGDQGRKLALLVDPQLAASQKSNINVSVNQQQITTSTPQALMSAIVSDLERRGVPRSQITGEMVRNLIGIPDDERQQAIEAVATET